MSAQHGPASSRPSPSLPPPLIVSFESGLTPGDQRKLSFTQPFRIGRGDDCEVSIKNEFVSRVHVTGAYENGTWLIRDGGSANGLFVDGQRVPSAAVPQSLTIRLGIRGPFVSFAVEPPPPPPSAAMTNTGVHRYVERYFAKPAGDEPVGDHTRMMRVAFAQVQTKQRRKYGMAFAILGVLVVMAGAFGFYEHQRLGQQKRTAEELFYTMKSLDLDIANVEKLVADSSSEKGKQEIQKYQSRRKGMEKSYDQFLTSLHIYDPKMSEQDRLVMRISRIFGECELDMPPGFVAEVQSYIKKWQSSGRLANAVKLANEKGYTSIISRELLAQDLPPQFFYLALQESDFDAYISGPMTYKGIAKGMWQFIPETAVKYGLHIGPLVDLRRPDPGDDRHHYDRATKAAALYLKDLYSTDAQASGLLVMASYNWGEDRVIKRIRSMPANPRERNFWKLLTLYRDQIPQETYDYVFYIVSAAVIGENPRLFGFTFDNPLGHLESK